MPEINWLRLTEVNQKQDGDWCIDTLNIHKIYGVWYSGFFLGVFAIALLLAAQQKKI